MPAWSFSALSSFETCEWRHYRTRVKKDVVEVFGDEVKWGEVVHKNLEKYVVNGQPLPADCLSFKPVVDRIIAAPGITYGEREFTLSAAFQPTGWWSPDAWVRVKTDIMKLNKSKAFVGDWKTGKIDPKSDQLKLTAAVVFHHEPAVNTVISAFAWFKHNKLSPETYTRDQLPEIWNEFLPRVKRFDLAFQNDKWVKKPSGLCKRYCPVKDCEFNGAYGS